MSSRFGPRAAGTDGTDFKHRQKIAAHYQISVQYKAYLKWLFALHGLVLIVMWAKVGGEFLVTELGISWRSFQALDLPSAYPWEYVWTLSFIPIVFGLASFPRNKVRLLRYSYYAQFVTGILPCAIGIGSQLPELMAYLRNMKDSQTLTLHHTFPMVILWYIFFLIAFQIHGFAMYCAYHLTIAWEPPKKTEQLHGCIFIFVLVTSVVFGILYERMCFHVPRIDALLVLFTIMNVCILVFEFALK
ncbi:hypothetical protein AB6A40_010548 [Gnathostoma spinigerum]|uniref:Uncharacterized protein n=1 Tax=Gnathostoma spinigerum TaxID=75299 RepID=A0ABD6F1S1_9BILA